MRSHSASVNRQVLLYPGWFPSFLENTLTMKSIDSYARRAHAMIILNEKQPPPPYASSPTHSASSGPPPFDYARHVPKLDGLPPHILLRIVNLLFPSTTVDATIHRKTLYWMAMCLRLVSRGLYIGSPPHSTYSVSVHQFHHAVYSMYAYSPVSVPHILYATRESTLYV